MNVRRREFRAALPQPFKHDANGTGQAGSDGPAMCGGIGRLRQPRPLQRAMS